MTPQTSITAESAGAGTALPKKPEKQSPAAQESKVLGKAPKGKLPAKKKANVSGKAPKVSRQELGRQVAVELSKVRSVLREVGSGVVDRLDGEAASLALFLDGDCLPGEKALLPSARTLKAMAVAFGGLKVKPKKGRVKDLARIELLLMVLASKMPPGR
jgi:hypothetical protein